MNTPSTLGQSKTFAPATASGHTRLLSLALSVVFTLSMLGGIHTLATSDSGAAPQMAQASTPRG